MRRLVVALVIIVVVGSIGAGPVAAGRKWCARDPLVSLNGAPVQIVVAVPEEFVPAVNGPVAVTVQTPSDVERVVLYTDDGFNGHGEIVEFTSLMGATIADDGSFPIRISAEIPVDVDLLRSLGNTSKRVPFQINVAANGELQQIEGEAPMVINGESWSVEGSSPGTKVMLTVKPVAADPLLVAP